MNGFRRISVSVITVLLCAVTVPGTAEPAAADETVVYLVRHAEKRPDATDPALSTAGRERARLLADLLAETGIDAIHSTDFRRTRDTAAPLAQRLGLPVSLYDADRPDALIETIFRAGGRHLVVGHSNTVPELVALLGGDGGPPIDEAEEYDRLYVVTRADDDAARTELRRYGARFTP
ncbi:MAG: phosphoglycerate mutase family protein [Xanthomonadales bacterium]